MTRSRIVYGLTVLLAGTSFCAPRAQAAASSAPVAPKGYQTLVRVFLTPQPTASTVLDALGPVQNKTFQAMPQMKVTNGTVDVEGLGTFAITVATISGPDGRSAINYLVQKPSMCLPVSQIVTLLRAAGVPLAPYKNTDGIPRNPERLKYLLEAQMSDGVLDVDSDDKGCLVEIYRAAHN